MGKKIMKIKPEVQSYERLVTVAQDVQRYLGGEGVRTAMIQEDKPLQLYSTRLATLPDDPNPAAVKFAYPDLSNHTCLTLKLRAYLGKNDEMISYEDFRADPEGKYNVEEIAKWILSTWRHEIQIRSQRAQWRKRFTERLHQLGYVLQAALFRNGRNSAVTDPGPDRESAFRVLRDLK